MVALHTGLVVGRSFADRTVTVSVGALGRALTLVVSVHSTAQQLLTDHVGPAGVSGLSTHLPTYLPAGVHVIEASASSSGNDYVEALPFSINSQGIVTALGPSSLLAPGQPVNDASMALSLATNLPAYSPAAHPLESAGVVVTGAALLSLVAIGSAAGMTLGTGAGAGAGAGAGSGSISLGRSGARREGRELADDAIEGLELMVLERVGEDREAWGDKSWTWRLPGTANVDRFFVRLASRLARMSAAIPRVTLDGTWARAIFGSGSVALVLAGALTGVVGAATASWSPLIPSFGVLLALLVISALDTLAAVAGWLVLVVAALAFGRGVDLMGLRTAIGLVITVVATTTLAQVVRPLRRFLLDSSTERFERVIDYSLVPFAVAIGVGAALRGLNGLSGLEITNAAQIDLARWIVAGVIIVRLGLEDIATHLYPRRMMAVHPEHLDELSVRATITAIAIRTVIFFLIAVPYIGFGATSLVGAALVVVPQVTRLYDERLPDIGWIDRWLPRGFTLFALTLVIGQVLSTLLVGVPGTPAALRGAFIWIILPSVVFKVLDSLAKHPVAPWSRGVRLAVGAPLALVAILVGTGAIVVVH